jgi:hypothetical protein
VVATLASDRVFVVQFSQDADLSHGRLAGKLEHVDSGRSVRFASAEELNEAFSRIFRDVDEPQTDRDTESPARNHSRRP